LIQMATSDRRAGLARIRQYSRESSSCTGAQCHRSGGRSVDLPPALPPDAILDGAYSARCRSGEGCHRRGIQVTYWKQSHGSTSRRAASSVVVGRDLVHKPIGVGRPTLRGARRGHPQVAVGAGRRQRRRLRPVRPAGARHGVDAHDARRPDVTEDVPDAASSFFGQFEEMRPMFDMLEADEDAGQGEGYWREYLRLAFPATRSR
jgi:hypothetical protein